MSKQNTGFRHYRYTTTDTKTNAEVTTTRGGVTLAFNSPKHIADLTAEDRVSVGFAFCSGEDNFCRESGRDVAIQRMAAADSTFGLPGDQFQQLIHAQQPADIINALTGLDQDQYRHMKSMIKSTTPTC